MTEALERAFTFGVSPNGLFASKLLWRELLYVSDSVRQADSERKVSRAELLESKFPNCRYIWVTRRDKVRQAVSYARAVQSGVWVSKYDQGGRALPLKFNSQLIASPLRQIVWQEAAWAQYFAESGIVPLTVVYEDLVLDYEPTIRRVLDFLEIPLPKDYVFPPPGIARQADMLSEEWARRYYRAERARYVRQTIANIPAAIRSRILREAYIKPKLTQVHKEILSVTRHLKSRRSP